MYIHSSRSSPECHPESLRHRRYALLPKKGRTFYRVFHAESSNVGRTSIRLCDWTHPVLHLLGWHNIQRQCIRDLHCMHTWVLPTFEWICVLQRVPCGNVQRIVRASFPVELCQVCLWNLFGCATCHLLRNVSDVQGWHLQLLRRCIWDRPVPCMSSRHVQPRRTIHVHAVPRRILLCEP